GQVTVDSIASGAVYVSANRDGAGTEGFTQASGTIRATGQASYAVAVFVNSSAGGTGDADLLAIDAPSGGVIVWAYGCVLFDADNDTTTNVTAGGADFRGASIGTSANPLDIAVDSLTTDTSAANGDQWVHETDGLSELSVNAGTGAVHLTLDAGAVL